MEPTLTDIFKVLSDDNRLKIIKMVAKGKKCANQILDGLGISQPTLSHHMRILTEIGLVKAQKQGTLVYYELDKAKVNCLCRFVREISCGENFCGKRIGGVHHEL